MVAWSPGTNGVKVSDVLPSCPDVSVPKMSNFWLSSVPTAKSAFSTTNLQGFIIGGFNGFTLICSQVFFLKSIFEMASSFQLHQSKCLSTATELQFQSSSLVKCIFFHKAQLLPSLKTNICHSVLKWDISTSVCVKQHTIKSLSRIYPLEDSYEMLLQLLWRSKFSC